MKEVIRTYGTSDREPMKHLIAEYNKLLVDAAALRAFLADRILQIGTLLISAVAAEKFKTTTVLFWQRLGIQFTLAATDNLVFSAADTINTGAAAGQFWGVWLVQVTDAGVVSTKSPAADQLYATEALAIAALPAADAGKVAIGYITVRSKANIDWVATVDDLTPASDCDDANFYDAAVLALAAITADDIVVDGE
jgi:hypothetical protein